MYKATNASQAAHRDWARCVEASQKLREINDCTVKALALATDGDYDRAHRQMTTYGRRHRKGAYFSTINGAFESLGYYLEPVKAPPRKNGSRYTMKTIGGALPDGVYLLFTGRRDHVSTLVYGEVIDWANNTNKRVTEIWRVNRNI